MNSGKIKKMIQCKFYCTDNSELAEFEAQQRGFRKDIVVGFNNNFYNIIIYDLTRLSQDFFHEIEEYGYYDIDPNLILVRAVNSKEIIFTVERLLKQGYFDGKVPISPDILSLYEYR